MKKVLLLSILVGPLILAARTARAKNPQQSFRKFLVQLVVFNVFYMVMLTMVWSRL